MFFSSVTRSLYNITRAFSSQGQTTIDSEEVFKFNELCDEFWDMNGPFQALHTMNKLRVPLIKNALSHDKNNNSKSNSKPLQDKTILDIGCGGGILSEPLSRLGATVTGIDASEGAISVAKFHAKHDPDIGSRLNYECITAEELLKESPNFDAVVASEVIEHVNDQELFIKTCSQLTKPGGSLILTTINRTSRSGLLAIIGAEYILGVVERGTHDWNKFVPDDELASLVISNCFTVDIIQGMCYNPFNRVWSNISDTSVNYALVAHKEHTDCLKDQVT